MNTTNNKVSVKTLRTVHGGRHRFDPTQCPSLPNPSKSTSVVSVGAKCLCQGSLVLNINIIFHVILFLASSHKHVWKRNTQSKWRQHNKKKNTFWQFVRVLKAKYVHTNVKNCEYQQLTVNVNSMLTVKQKERN